MEPYSLDQQKKRLALVSKQQWREALATLTRHMTKKLHARVVYDKQSPDGRLVGGRTVSGAHSDLNLGGNALFHYHSGVLVALYHGAEEWLEDEELLDAMIRVVDKLMKQEVSDYTKRRRHIGICTEGDVETLPEAQQPTDDGKERVDQLQMIWDAVEGEENLERYVDAQSRHKKLDGVCSELGISKRDADNLRKKVIRRTKKIKEQ